MLSNLIKNALEASPQGERIRVELADEEDMALIRIHNRGAMPEDIRDRFFDKYATSGKESGTGLGIYSARLIAETQGGSVHLDTSEEKGTAVTVRLPGRTPEDIQRTAARAEISDPLSEFPKESERKSRSIITSDRLNALPEEFTAALKTSAEMTDLKGSNVVIECIREHDEPLADALSDLTKKILLISYKNYSSKKVSPCITIETLKGVQPCAWCNFSENQSAENTSTQAAHAVIRQIEKTQRQVGQKLISGIHHRISPTDNAVTLII